MRLVYRSISAPLLGELAVTALRIARDEQIDGVALGPRSVPRLLEIGLVIDGPKGKVEALDGKLQRELRKKKIPYVRRDVTVFRNDTGPATMSSSPPVREELIGVRVETDGREPQRHAAPTAAVSPPVPPTIVNEVKVPASAPTPVNVNVHPTPVNVAAPVVHVPAPQIQFEQAPAIPVQVRVESAPPTPMDVKVSLPEVQAPPVGVKVEAPVVNVPAPIVNVQAPEVRIPAVLPPQVTVQVPEPIVKVEVQAQPAPIVHVDLDSAVKTLGQMILAAFREVMKGQKAPVVHVTVPEVKVPKIAVPPAIVNVTVEPPSPVKVSKVIKRDTLGRISAVEETPEGLGQG